MPNLICNNNECAIEFYSKHKKAKYCSRHCSGLANSKKTTNLNKGSVIYPNHVLIDKLIELSIILNRTPSKNDMDHQKGFPAARTYQIRFGSWTNAIEKAEMMPNIKIPKGLSREISAGIRFDILKRDNFTCTYCGGTPKDGYVLVVDHIIPFVKGGKTTHDNLTTACFSCNNGKSDKIL